MRRNTRIRRQEQDWWDHQFSLQILDWSADAWVTTHATRSILYAANVTIRSGLALPRRVFSRPTSVQWRLEEVMAVGRAVSNIAKVFGNNARHLIGGATIFRMHAARWPLVIMWAKCAAFEALGRVYMNDSAFRTMEAAEHILTHELGHYLAESQHLIGGFKRGRSQDFPNEYAKIHRASEDFAASFEIFVFESIGRPVVEVGESLTVDRSRQSFFAQFVDQHGADRL